MVISCFCFLFMVLVSLFPLVDDAADAKVEEGEGGEGNETEEDGRENHGEGGVEGVHSQSCWSDEVFGDHLRNNYKLNFCWLKQN